MESRDLDTIFKAATILVGPSQSSEVARSPDLKGIFSRRLSDYYGFIGSPRTLRDSATLEGEQLDTALEALYLLELLHRRLVTREKSSEPLADLSAEKDHSLIGARDLALIRTLLSIVFKWATDPLVQRIVAAIPSTSGSHMIPGARIIDLTGLPYEYSSLSTISSRLLALPLFEGKTSPLSQSAVTATLLNQHLPDLLLPCIVVGWLPKSYSSELMPTRDATRPQIMHLLSRLPASQVISAVGRALSTSPTSLPYVRKSCTFILGRQLMRPDGIHGLCESVFGEEELSEEEAPLDKLENVARVLSSVPSGMKPEEYCNTVIPRMLRLLGLQGRALLPIHRRAIVFSLSRMLTRTDTSNFYAAAVSIVLRSLHGPVLHGTGEMSTAASLQTIQVLLTNTDPSPHLISMLLTPVVPSIYALHAHLEGTKTSDPLLREMLKGFLETWGRLVATAEVIATLRKIIDGDGGKWHVDVAGAISRTEDEEQDATPLLFTPESLKQAEEAGELNADSNILGLKPDPARFVRFIKAMYRADVSSALFVELLEGYRQLRSNSEADPLRTLLHLQLILQMQTQLSTDDASGVLKKPEHILSFIKHALENTNSRTSRSFTKNPASDQGLRMEDLRVVPEDADELDDGGDSDDEEPDAGLANTVDDMTTTSVKLLLAVLEANPDLSARTDPVLNDIFSLLEPFSTVTNEELRSLVREARMVMTARLASTSDTSSSKRRQASSGETESPQETYQKALKLLQDPLLPVRAHGLMLLRQLVSARKGPAGGLSEPPLDRALIPGILSIFMQSIQDDDSYMFLNAVQGLSAMVDGYGKDVLRGLVNTYAAGLEGLSASAMSQHDVDMRTRVGEALAQVIRRCGEALPSYASLLVGPLFQAVRASQFPTVLRASAISLLAQCVKTCALAILPYVVDVADAMVDLLQVESVPAAPPKVSSSSEQTSEAKEKSEEATEPASSAPTMDSQPTSSNTKFPPLRRAALHFLTLLIQACTNRVYETGSAEGLLLSPRLMTRTKTTLRYIAATDADGVVRVMARETAEGLDQLAEALIGL